MLGKGGFSQTIFKIYDGFFQKNFIMKFFQKNFILLNFILFNQMQNAPIEIGAHFIEFWGNTFA